MSSELNKQGISLKEKKKKWDEVRKLVDETTDKIGNPIDPDIRELITGLNLFGFNTYMSCFGHIRDDEKLDVKEYANTPRVSIKIQIDEELEKRQQELREIAFANKDHKNETAKKTYKEYYMFMENAPFPYKKYTKKLIGLLSEFYEQRQVSYDVQLLVWAGHSDITIKNLGEINRYFNDQATKKKKIKDYQAEFVAFGEFLKNKYLQGNGK